MTYPSGRVVNFRYATGGGCCNSRLDAVGDATTNTLLAATISYNAAGETVTRTLNPGASAVTEAFTYNTRLEQTGIMTSVGGTTVMNFAYDYGTSTTNTGRVLSRTDSIQQEHSAKYSYDPFTGSVRWCLTMHRGELLGPSINGGIGSTKRHKD
jgi:hypothetical protein